MHVKIIQLHFKTFLLSFIIPLILASCSVRLIGAYDQVTDESIQQIQNEISTLIVKIERNIDNKTFDENKYDNFKTSYENIFGEIESLKIRCSAIPDYKLVLDQVELLKLNIRNLESLHKLGFSTKEQITPVKSALEIQFVAMIKLQNALKREKQTK
ncbi:MAG TPA: hypothetical protein PKK00_09260 [Bacteroidales bacterium]|nr:hypothetical protein [Bacteroidales bacterium]HPS17058.1 hypothetical protein [Bacteroidales bacterium]